MRTAAVVSALVVACAGTLLGRQQPSPATPPAPPQQSPPQSSPSPAPQFTAGVNLVEVDVSVTDRNHEPVTNLTSKDFEIREDGHLQPIQLIYLTTLDRMVLASAPPDASAGVQSPDRRAMQQRVFIFFLDTAHLSPAGFARSRDALVTFIKAHLPSANLVGIVANGQMLGKRIGLGRDELLAALAEVKQPNLARYNEMRTFPKLLDEAEASKIARSDERALDDAAARACTEQPGQCRGAGGDDLVRNELVAKAAHLAAEIQRDTLTTLAALESLANGLGRIPGPKQVTVFSEGFYTDDTTAWLKQTVTMAARNGVHFSTFDARGIARDLRSTDFLDASPLAASGDVTALGSDPNADALTSLALDTGGRRFFNYNNLTEPLEQLSRETSTYYVLGFRPAKAFDGTYRTLDVKVLRPDVTVRARRGYVAVHQPPTPAPSAEASIPGSTPGTPNASMPSPGDKGTSALEVLRLATGRSGIGAVRPPDDAPVSRPDSLALVTKLADAPAGAGASAPAEASRLAHEGWQLYARGQVEDAREKLAAAAAAAPGVAWIAYALGQAEFTLQHLDAAASAFEQVRKALPAYEPAYFDLADSYLQLQRQGDALAVLREAARRWPDDPETHLAVGCVLVRRNALDDAVDSFKRAIAIAPDNGNAHFNLALTYHLIYIRFVGSSTSNALAASMLGARNRDLAIAEYRKYLELGGPFAEDARRALAALGWSAGD